MSATPRTTETETADPGTGAAGNPAAKKIPHKRPLNRIAGMPAAYFAVLAAILLVAAFTGVLPDTMVVGFAVSIVLGGALAWIGGLVPVIRDYGLPTILCTFIPATLMFAGVMPEPVVTVVQNFLGGYGFLDFFVVAVIAGTILGMPRTLLIKAGPRFAVPLLGCIVFTFLIVGAIGFVTGYGFIQAILFIAAPVMAGGLGVGALPMSEMYAAQTGSDASVFMGDLMSAVVIANIVCILVAGIYNGMGRNGKQLFVGFNGHGELMRIKGKKSELTMPPKKSSATFVALGQGIAIAGVLLVVGTLLNAWIPFLHEYAWTIVAAAVIKILGLLPFEMEEASSEWGEMLTTYFVPALLVGVSITYINIEEVLVSLSDPMFIILTAAAVVTSGLVAGTLGWLVKFNFVEASITPGLVMADTGGSGDVSVLSAADRMHMMPFAAMTTRLGGALTLFLTSLLVPMLSSAA